MLSRPRTLAVLFALPLSVCGAGAAEIRIGVLAYIRAEIWRCIETLKAQGQAILVIDKNVRVLQRMADRQFIIERGWTVWSGTSAELTAAPELIARYVGV